MTVYKDVKSQAKTTEISRLTLVKYSGLTGLIWLIFCLSAQAAQDLRIAIKKGVSAVQIGSSTPAIVRDAGGRAIGNLAPLDGFTVKPRGSGVNLNQWNSSHLIIEPKDDGVVWIGDRWYRGKVRVIRQGKEQPLHVAFEVLSGHPASRQRGRYTAHRVRRGCKVQILCFGDESSGVVQRA